MKRIMLIVAMLAALTTVNAQQESWNASIYQAYTFDNSLLVSFGMSRLQDGSSEVMIIFTELRSSSGHYSFQPMPGTTVATVGKSGEAWAFKMKEFLVAEDPDGMIVMQARANKEATADLFNNIQGMSLIIPDGTRFELNWQMSQRGYGYKPNFRRF